MYTGEVRQNRKLDGFKNEYLFVLPDELLSRFLERELFKFLIVTDIGYFPFAKYHFCRRPNGCENAILIYCSAGTGFYSIDGGDTLPLSSGQFIVIPPNTPHVYGASDQNPWSVYWAHVRGSFFVPYYEMTARYLPIKISDVIGEQFKELFHQCFALLKNPYQYEEYFYLCQLAGTIFALAACSGKEPEARLTPNGNRGIDRALAFMKDHLHQIISLDQLANAAGFSPSHLHNLFKRSTGSAPVEYFLRMKIQAASKDLYFSNLPVKDIAVSYGIEDPYYFSRLFKKIMGVSPMKYRSQIKG
jgi:AraC-like DNA-binding protein